MVSAAAQRYACYRLMVTQRNIKLHILSLSLALSLSQFPHSENLVLVKSLGDRAAEGRACGNLGNTHYLLGNFNDAIKYHEQVWSLSPLAACTHNMSSSFSKF